MDHFLSRFGPMYGDVVPGDMIIWELAQKRTAAVIVISVIFHHAPHMASKSDVSLLVIWMWDATTAHPSALGSTTR